MTYHLYNAETEEHILATPVRNDALHAALVLARQHSSWTINLYEDDGASRSFVLAVSVDDDPVFQAR